MLWSTFFYIYIPNAGLVPLLEQNCESPYTSNMYYNFRKVKICNKQDNQ